MKKLFSTEYLCTYSYCNINLHYLAFIFMWFWFLFLYLTSFYTKAASHRSRVESMYWYFKGSCSFIRSTTHSSVYLQLMYLHSVNSVLAPWIWNSVWSKQTVSALKKHYIRYSWVFLSLLFTCNESYLQIYWDNKASFLILKFLREAMKFDSIIMILFCLWMWLF